MYWSYSTKLRQLAPHHYTNLTYCTRTVVFKMQSQITRFSRINFLHKRAFHVSRTVQELQEDGTKKVSLATIKMWKKQGATTNGLVYKTLSANEMDTTKNLMKELQHDITHIFSENWWCAIPAIAFLIGTINWAEHAYLEEVKSHRS